MKWLELSIDTTPDGIELVSGLLAAYGVDSLMIDEEGDFRSFLENNRQYWDYVDEELENRFLGVSRIKCYLTDDADGLAVLRQIRAAYPELTTAFVEDSDWENNWRDYYRPIAVGSKLVVVPEWEEIPDGGRLALRLDPGLTFGTGSHATTRLCLQALENWAAPGKRVLDLGCGSGILGIGALILGCESCLGVDVDPKSPDVASDNAALNGLHEDRIRFLAGDLLADTSLRRRLGTGYDIVLANIVADVIIPLSPHVPAFLAPGGVYISSGIIDGRQEEVRRAIEDSGFRILSHSSEDGWHCFAAAL